MKRKLLAIILAFVMMFALVGCAEEADRETVSDEPFVVVENYIDDFGSRIVIYVHKETRVMYLSTAGNYNGGVTVMLDADGKPLLWEGEL